MPPAPAVIRDFTDIQLVMLAREIAKDIKPIATILEEYQISTGRWSEIQLNRDFTRFLETEQRDWQSAANTNERIKLKAAAMTEEWLPEANKLLHKDIENLASKTELAKFVARLAGIGMTGVGVEGGGGDKFSVTINLGADNSLKFEKQAAPVMIEAQAL